MTNASHTLVDLPSAITHLPSLSAQPELNRHIRPGKAAGNRYIIGALAIAIELSKTHEKTVTNDQRSGFAPPRGFGHWGLVIGHSPSGTGGDRTHIGRFKRPVHCPVCHNPVSVGAAGVEPRAPIGHKSD